MAMVPPWLYYFAALSMLCVAGYSSFLLGMVAWSRRAAGWDVHVSHLAMGVAMAGMFVGGWSFGPSGMWEAVFAVLGIWFAVGTIRSLLDSGFHVPHTAIHAVMSLAMLLMYWFPMTRGQDAPPMSMSMSGSASTTGRLDPGVAFVVAALLLAYAVFTLASPNKGRSVYGSHLALATQAAAPVAGRYSLEARLPGTVSSVDGFEGVASRPWLLDVAHVVMTVGMGFMLVLML